MGSPKVLLPTLMTLLRKLQVVLTKVTWQGKSWFTDVIIVSSLLKLLAMSTHFKIMKKKKSVNEVVVNNIKIQTKYIICVIQKKYVM